MLHAWGMTEMTPARHASAGSRATWTRWPEDERYAVRAKQGTPAAGVDMRVVDDEGDVVPWDGKTMGEIQVRGPWVAAATTTTPSGADRFTDDGWFRTGDVATHRSRGYIQITDRTKDLIKSGGEWISSVDLENTHHGPPEGAGGGGDRGAARALGGAPAGLRRPQARAQGTLTARRDPRVPAPRVAKWWLPDEVVFIDAVPKTSVGKFDKKVLRERFKAWKPK